MKENFDDILKRRWEERQFPVDDVHRQEMAKLLEGDKKRRGLIFWWLGSLAVVMVAGYLIWMNMHPIEAKAKAEAEAKSEAEVKTEVMSNAEVEIPGNNSKENNAASNTNVRADKAPAKATLEFNKDKNQNSSKGNNTTTSKSKAVKQKELPAFTSQGNKINTVQQNENVAIALPAQKDNSQFNAINEVPPAEGYKVELENPNQATLLSDEAAIRVFPDSLEYDPWTNAIYRDGTVRSLNITKPIDDLDISEVEIALRQPGQITPHTKITHPLYFIAETGLGLVMASKPYYDGGIKFNVGGGLGMKLIPKVHLQLTGGYLMQDGGFNFEKTSTVQTLGFGVRSQFNTLEPDRLHFIYGKIGAAYRFNRSTIDSHFGVQWLYGSQGNITTQEESQVPPFQNGQTHYAWLNTDGLRKTQWWWDVSYGYMVFPKFYIHGGVSYYFTSLTEADNPQNDYSWKGKTAKVQPFVTINYLLHANL